MHMIRHHFSIGTFDFSFAATKLRLHTRVARFPATDCKQICVEQCQIEYSGHFLNWSMKKSAVLVQSVSYSWNNFKKVNYVAKHTVDNLSRYFRTLHCMSHFVKMTAVNWVCSQSFAQFKSVILMAGMKNWIGGDWLLFLRNLFFTIWSGDS